MIDLKKYMANDQEHTPFHTSGYAEVANGARVGAVDSHSFEERQRIERNRQMIAGYTRSTIGQSYGQQRAKPVLSRDVSRSSVRPRDTSPQPSSVGQRSGFSEPKGQSYNPYA